MSPFPPGLTDRRKASLLLTHPSFPLFSTSTGRAPCARAEHQHGLCWKPCARNPLQAPATARVICSMSNLPPSSKFAQHPCPYHPAAATPLVYFAAQTFSKPNPFLLDTPLVRFVGSLVLGRAQQFKRGKDLLFFFRPAQWGEFLSPTPRLSTLSHPFSSLFAQSCHDTRQIRRDGHTTAPSLAPRSTQGLGRGERRLAANS